MLFRKHSALALIKGWNKHLARYATDKFTNHSRLRQWFRRMLIWAHHHSFQYKTKENRITKTKQVWKPKTSKCQDHRIEATEFRHTPTDIDTVSVSGEQANWNDDLLSLMDLSAEQVVQSQAQCSEVSAKSILSTDTWVQSQAEGSEISTSELLLEFENHSETLELGNEMKALSDLQRKRKFDRRSFRVKCPNCLQAFKNEHAMAVHKKLGHSKCMLAANVRAYLLTLKSSRNLKGQAEVNNSIAQQSLKESSHRHIQAINDQFIHNFKLLMQELIGNASQGIINEDTIQQSDQLIFRELELQLQK